MLRSILVALDGSISSMKAGRLALDLARRHNAHVAGFGIVNSVWIQRPEPVPIGGMSIKVASDLKRLQSATERVAAVLQRFQDEAGQHGVSSLDLREAKGDPIALIEAEATAHDLVVIGRDSMFDVEGELYDVPLYVDRIIRREPRPVLLAPRSADESADGEAKSGMNGPVVVAFDGSPAASRALHMFALLGLAEGRLAHVLTIDKASAKAAEATAAQACALLLRHGVAEAHAVGLGDTEAGAPDETILGLAKALDAGMIVMGAYGHSGIREIFGSCTRAVVNASPRTLFLYH